MDVRFSILVVGEIIMVVWSVFLLWVLILEFRGEWDSTLDRIVERLVKIALHNYCQLPNGQWFKVCFAKRCGFDVVKVNGMNKAVRHE